jgi:heterotetrameric sarcosine oxidase delta subunit
VLSIPCPYCGFRDETEFTYGGPSHVQRPDISATDREWTKYLYHRANTKGPYRERWLHSFGCGRWFNMLRDTATHDILEVYLMEQSKSSSESSQPSGGGSIHPPRGAR